MYSHAIPTLSLHYFLQNPLSVLQYIVLILIVVLLAVILLILLDLSEQFRADPAMRIGTGPFRITGNTSDNVRTNTVHPGEYR